MAKIMGLELKAVKTFIGSDGYGLNANLYYKGKKVAFVLDEGNGGELMVYFADKDKQEKVLAVANRYYEKYPKYLFHDTDWAKLTELVEELYDLYETEKYFKKSLKKRVFRGGGNPLLQADGQPAGQLRPCQAGLHGRLKNLERKSKARHFE